MRTLSMMSNGLGHIAMWNGTQWVSDFKQKNFIVASGYAGSKYKFYRHKYATRRKEGIRVLFCVGK